LPEPEAPLATPAPAVTAHVLFPIHAAEAEPARDEPQLEAEPERSRGGMAVILALALAVGGAGWYIGSFLDSERASTEDRTAASETEDEAEPAPRESSAAAPAPAAGAQAAAPSRVWVTVNINADPWANIWIDGRELGDTPLADVPLAMGEHRFRAVFKDGRVVERTIDIDREQRFISFE
jgi:hypothetical protein